MAPRLDVVLGRSANAGRICRVEAPGRVLRIWALLNDADNELYQVSLPPAAAPRLQRQLDALTGELERSVSPALAGELRHLIPQGQAAAPTADELRVEYASLLGWTGGLVIGMLSQIEAASEGRPVQPSHPACSRSARGSGLTAAARPAWHPARGLALRQLHDRTAIVGHELAGAVQAGRIGRMRSQRRDFGVPAG